MDIEKALNVGVAAHIHAAAPRGPRYLASQTTIERRSSSNGIWLCQRCGKLVDNDELRYTADEIRKWKLEAERRTLDEVESGSPRTRLALVDCGLCASTRYQRIDVKVRNPSSTVAFIKGVRVTTRRSWTLNSDLDVSFVPLTHDYRIKIPTSGRIRTFPLSQALSPQEVDRFGLTYSRPRASRWFGTRLHLVEIELLYNETDRLYTVPMLLDVPPSADLAGACVHRMSSRQIAINMRKARQILSILPKGAVVLPAVQAELHHWAQQGSPNG